MALMMTLPSALDCQLKRDAGMNVFEYHVLAALSDAPDRTLRAQRAGSDRPGFAVPVVPRRVAAWSEPAGCSAARRDDAGHRSVAKLTPAGMRRLEEVAPGHVREARRLVVDDSRPEQLAALGAAARAIVPAESLRPRPSEHAE